MVDAHLLIDGIFNHVEGVWVGASFKMDLDGSGGIESRGLAACGVSAPPDETAKRIRAPYECPWLPSRQLCVYPIPQWLRLLVGGVGTLHGGWRGMPLGE